MLRQEELGSFSLVLYHIWSIFRNNLLFFTSTLWILQCKKGWFHWLLDLTNLYWTSIKFFTSELKCRSKVEQSRGANHLVWELLETKPWKMWLVCIILTFFTKTDCMYSEGSGREELWAIILHCLVMHFEN